MIPTFLFKITDFTEEPGLQLVLDLSTHNFTVQIEERMFWNVEVNEPQSSLSML